LPIIVGIRYWTAIGKDLKILLFLLLIGFLIDCFTGWRHHDVYLHELAYTYILVELFLVMYIIIFWQESLRVKRLLQIIVVLYVIFWTYAGFTFKVFPRLYSIVGSVSKTLFVLSAGYTLFVVVENRLGTLKNDKRFWILLSFVLNSGGTLMPFALQDLLRVQSKQALFIAWSITLIITVMSNILFTVGFLCPQKQT
jgi:hypothetical protein